MGTMDPCAVGSSCAGKQAPRLGVFRAQPPQVGAGASFYLSHAHSTLHSRSAQHQGCPDDSRALLLGTPLLKPSIQLALLSSTFSPSLPAQLDSQPGYTAPGAGPGQVELLPAPEEDDAFGLQQRRPLVRSRRHASAGSAQGFGQLMDESHTDASYGAACRAIRRFIECRG